jgi:hypothetical protein
MSTTVTLCFDNGLQFNPAIVHVDIELAAMKVLKKIYEISALNVTNFILRRYGGDKYSRFKSGILKV